MHYHSSTTINGDLPRSSMAYPIGNYVCSSGQKSDFLSLSERTAYFSGLAFQTESVSLPNQNQRCVLLRCRA
jgi:hypothetical protein